MLESILPSGAEEWRCLLCERRVVKLSRHTDARSLVIQPGDEAAKHFLDGQLLADTDDALLFEIAEKQRLPPWPGHRGTVVPTG